MNRPATIAAWGARAASGRILRVLLLLIGGLPLPAAGELWQVSPDGSGDYPTIQAALDVAADGDVIELADGVFTGEGNRDLDCRGQAVTVRSQNGDAALCVIDCAGSADSLRIGFDFSSGEGPDTRIENLTVTGGWHDTYAGGLICNRSSPTISGCILIDNCGYMGGAILCDSASPVITAVAFLENRASFGAGIQGLAGSSPTIRNCAFVGNDASYDSGAFGAWFYGSPLIENCVFGYNTGVYRAGAILIGDDVVATLTDCTFHHNASPYGGAANICGGSTVCFRNCTFYADSASEAGSALVCGCHAYACLDNSILAYGTSGQAVSCWSTGTAVLRCCDVYGNAGGDWVDCIADQAGIDGNFSADPLFCDAEGENWRLHADSPCLPGQHPSGDACGLIGAWAIGCPTGDVPRPSSSRHAIRLLRGLPNPCAHELRIEFELGPASVAAHHAWTQSTDPHIRSPLEIEIFDPAGRRIRAWRMASSAAGRQTVVWNGRHQSGVAAQAGIYLCRLRFGEQLHSIPIVLVR